MIVLSYTHCCWSFRRVLLFLHALMQMSLPSVISYTNFYCFCIFENAQGQRAEPLTDLEIWHSVLTGSNIYPWLIDPVDIHHARLSSFSDEHSFDTMWTNRTRRSALCSHPPTKLSSLLKLISSLSTHLLEIILRNMFQPRQRLQILLIFSPSHDSFKHRLRPAATTVFKVLLQFLNIQVIH